LRSHGLERRLPDRQRFLDYRGGVLSRRDLPSAYTGALFFADHTRNYMWVMLPGSTGLTNAGNIVAFTPAAYPVDIKAGPPSLNSDLFYVDMEGGKVHRLTYTSGNQPPVARISANPTSGDAPLKVQFDATGSSDPEGGSLTYAWAFGDGGISSAAIVS
jgi:PKD repeat protein